MKNKTCWSVSPREEEVLFRVIGTFPKGLMKRVCRDIWFCSLTNKVEGLIIPLDTFRGYKKIIVFENIRSIGDPDRLAYVLFHEIGHYALKHKRWKTKAQQRKQEREATQFAKKHMKQYQQTND